MKTPSGSITQPTRAQLLSENGRLHREIEHRVRNTLQVVASLIDVTARSAGDRSALSVLESLRARVTAMIMVYQTLDDTPHRATINMDQTLRELVREVTEARLYTGPRRAVDIRSDGVNLPLDDAMPLALMVVEVLLAAHGDIDPGIDPAPIVVALSRDAHEGNLRIALEGAQSLSGPAAWPEATKAMMEALARQLGGPLKIDAHEGVPKAVEIRFPVRSLGEDPDTFC